MAGGQHHHRTNLDKYHPGYFGKVGMRYFHKQQAHFWKPVINLDKVYLLLSPYNRIEEDILIESNSCGPSSPPNRARNISTNPRKSPP